MKGTSRSSQRLVQTLIVGSGKPAVKTWDVSRFNRIRVRSVFHAKITKGKTFKVATTADDNVLPFVRVEKEGDVLTIEIEKGHGFQLKKSPEAEIVLPVLAGVELSGASVGRLEGFDSEKDVAIDLSGASKLEGALAAAKVKVKVGGASHLSLTGKADSAELSSEGASHLKLAEFPLKQGKLDLSGAGTAEIVVRSAEPFVGEISGASKLRGTVEAAELDLKVSGASHVTLSGKAKTAKLDVSDASHLQLVGPGERNGGHHGFRGVACESRRERVA